MYLLVLMFAAAKIDKHTTFSANGYDMKDLKDSEYGCCTRCPPSALRSIS